MYTDNNKRVLAKLVNGLETDKEFTVDGFALDCDAVATTFGYIERLNIKNMAFEDIIPNSDWGESMKAIIKFIEGSQLTRLTFSAVDPSFLVTILEQPAISSVLTLEFDYQRFNTREAECLIAAIKRTSLHNLLFRACTFENNTFAPIMCAISSSSLQHLQLGNSNDAASIIADCIGHGKLTKLTLCSNLSKESFITIAEAVKISTIQILDLEDSNANGYTEELVDLILHSRISKLCTNFCHLPGEKIIQLVDATRTNSFIKKMGISFDNLFPYSTEKMTAMCDLIEFLPLTYLKLKLHSLGTDDSQLARIINSLKESSITYLSLQLNTNPEHITADELRVICSLLEHGVLKKLDLRATGLTDELVGPILPLIRESSLIKFNVSDNYKLSAGIVAQIKVCTKQNKLDLSNVRFVHAHVPSIII